MASRPRSPDRTLTAVPSGSDVRDRLGQEPVDVKPEETDWRAWSVTTLIDLAIPKPGLERWKQMQVAGAIAEHVASFTKVAADRGRAAAVKYAMDLPWGPPGELGPADLGTVAHRLFQEMSITGRRPRVTAELHPKAADGFRLTQGDQRLLGMLLDQFERFLEEFQPVYEAAEVTVFNERFGYAGTADAFLALGGVPLIADYKTSATTYDARGQVKGPYPEVALQLAAYRHAELALPTRVTPRRGRVYSRRYYLLSAEERALTEAVPEVSGGVAIYVTPQSYGVYPVRCGDETFRRFLYCIEMARWDAMSRRAVGNSMIPPHPIAAPDDPFAGLPTYEE